MKSTTMDNTIILYNSALNFSLKQNVNNVNDLLYNAQNLKQFQNNIDQIQELKDKAQMQINMASIALLRSYILDEGYVGITLFRNLIRSFYPLNDEQILKYENIIEKNQYVITNINVLKRKGVEFVLNGQRYRLRPYTSASCVTRPDYNVLREISSIEELKIYTLKEQTSKTWALYWKDIFCAENRHIDLSNESILSEIISNDINFLIQNRGIIWTWEAIKNIKKIHPNPQLKWYRLVENESFMAQMGINSIENTLRTLQTITGMEMTEKEISDILSKYSNMGIKLYSYLPALSKSFIIEHQNELDWKVLIGNHHIQWDWDLINLLLKQCVNNVSESEWNTFLNNPSYAIYQVIEPFLNDELLNDIEKLYDL